MFLPIGVAVRERVGDVSARHQQECANHMNNTAAGQEDERGTEGHSILKEQLRRNKATSSPSLSSQPNKAMLHHTFLTVL